MPVPNRSRRPSCAFPANVTIVTAVLLFGAAGLQAQSAPPPPPDADASSEAVFDVGVLVQPPPGQYGITELMSAALAGDAATVKALLEAGADVNAADDWGDTALIRAAASGHAAVVELLLEAGADPEAPSRSGDTALAIAIKYRAGDVALVLLEHGADPDVTLQSGSSRPPTTVLERAAVHGQSAVVAAMIERGVDLANGGPAALNAALWRGHEDIAAALIAGGVDVDAAPWSLDPGVHLQTGDFPLQTAAQGGHVRSVELLLRHGADVNLRDRHGRSALHYAARNGHARAATVLLAHGALVSADDVAAAWSATHNELASRLLDSVDVASLSPAEHESLLTLADAAGDDAAARRLLAAEKADRPAEFPPSFLFARAGDPECRLVHWHPESGSERVVHHGEEACASTYFVSAARQALLIVSGDRLSLVSLDGTDKPRNVALPRRQIGADLDRLREQVRLAYGNNAGTSQDWMTADIVQAGFLESGELAVATHTGGPADETYGRIYALRGDTWQRVAESNCHRFDDCLFPQILGRPLEARPSTGTFWHPNVRGNPYFVSKSDAPATYGDGSARFGTVTFEIDGVTAAVRYGMSESGHCADDCVYTAGLWLRIDDTQEVVLTGYHGNNSVVGRYALVRMPPDADYALIDLATGRSLFGALGTAGWVN